jgi:hypothetical protein
MSTLATSRVADVRIIALVVVVLVHAALIAWLATARRTLPTAEISERETILIFLPDTTPREPQSQPAPERASREPRQIPAPVPPTAPPLITPQEERKPPAAVDWHEQAQLAATRQAEELARLESPGAGPGAVPSPGSPPRTTPEFRWSRSRTHRIEAIEGGGFLVWINDRCAIVITLLAMPVCKVGKIPVHGDLFEHMDDAPLAGDWKDE